MDWKSLLRFTLGVFVVATIAQATCFSLMHWIISGKFNFLGSLLNGLIMGTPTTVLSVLFSSVLPSRLRLRAAFGISVAIAVLFWSIGFLAESWRM